MSGKKGAKKGTGESKSDPILEQSLQAVLLIDTYNLYFSPLSSEYPPSLFPVANEPMLSYTLHFLRSAGVQELFIVGKHCPQEVVQGHLLYSSCSVLDKSGGLVAESLNLREGILTTGSF